MTEIANSNWSLPAGEPDVAANRPGRSPTDLKDWRRLTGRVAAIATQNGWTKAEVSRRSGVPDGTFNQWYSGKYSGRLDETNTRIRQWLDTAEEMDVMARAIPASPGFVETPGRRARSPRPCSTRR